MRRLALLTILALGCGGGDDEEITCDLAERSGAYVANFTTIDGNCGDQATAVLRLDASAEMGGCMLTAETSVSADQCTVTNSTLCPFDQLSPGATIAGTTVTQQEADDGSLLTGTTTMDVRDANGISVCFGTYRVRLERQ